MKPHHSDSFLAPRYARLYPRQTLLERLEEIQNHSSAIWLAAPQGAGKSALISDFAVRQNLDVWWFRIQASDADVERFEFRLRQLLTQLMGKAPVDGLAFDDPLQSIAALLRSLGSHLEPLALIVWDNCEFLDPAAPHLALLAQQIAASSKLQQVFISREAPPASFQPMLLQQQLSLLAWDDLRLTAEEAPAFAAFVRQSSVDADSVSQALQQSNGWITAFVLLLQGQQRSHTANRPDLEEQRFEALAEHVFAQISAQDRELLLSLSLYPRLSNSILQRHHAQKRMQNLAQTLPLIERDGAQAYRIHELLRQWLQQRLQQQLPPRQFQQRVFLAAAAMLQEQQISTAAELYCSIGAWPELQQLIRDHAETLLAQGAAQALRRYLQALPEAYQKDPWMLYWHGHSLRFSEWITAWPLLRQAFLQFKAQQEVLGQYQAWFSLAEAMLAVFEDIKAIKAWLREYQELRQRHPRCPSTGLRFKCTGLAAAMMSMVDPMNPRTRRWLRVAETGVRLIPFRAPRQAIFTYLILHYANTGQIACMHAMAKHLLPALDDASLPAPMRLFGHAMIGLHQLIAGAQEPELAINAAIELASQSGGGMFSVTPLSYRIYCELIEGREQRLDRYMAEMSQHLRANHRMDQAAFDFLSAWRNASTGRLGECVAQTELSRLMCQQLGFNFGVALNCNLRAQALTSLGDFAAAKLELELLAAEVEFSQSRLLQVMLGLSRAWLALKQNELTDCHRYLGETLALAEREGVYAFQGFLREVMAELALVGLRAQLAVAYCKRLVQRWRLQPKSLSRLDQNWPWPVQISLLGGLRLQIDGESISADNSARQRPLELLMALIALGGSSAQEVSKARLGDLLWPETEADKAAHALDNLLHRLRKIVGKHTIIINSGKVSLNPELCWVDCWALDALQHDELPLRAQQRAQYLQQLYRGHFAEGHDASWLYRAREQSRNLYVRLTQRIAAELLEQHQAGLAEELLERALLVDPLAELLYHQLLSYLVQSGREVDALRCYRNCVQNLQQQLGTGPGQAIEQLVQTALR